jgi:L-iditol 2-dehydrogenase
MQLVKASGARSIIVGTTPDRARLSLAKRLGVEFAINVDEEKDALARLIADLTDGYGADAVFGCAGTPAAFTLGIELLRKGGRYTQIALFTREIPFPIDKMSYHELKLQGSFAQRTSNWERALSLLGVGLVDTLPLATTMPMSQWEEAFALSESKKAVKVVLDPGR